MADKIQIRAGKKENMPLLTDRELGYVRDEKSLYIGTPSGNVDLLAELKETKLTATKVAAQDTVDEYADVATIAAAFNSLIAAMKSSGVMNT